MEHRPLTNGSQPVAFRQPAAGDDWQPIAGVDQRPLILSGLKGNSRLTIIGTRDQLDIEANELHARARGFAAQLAARFRSGNRAVLISAEAGLGVVVTLLATWYAGGHFAIIPNKIGDSAGRLSVDKLRHIISDFDPAVVVCDEASQRHYEDLHAPADVIPVSHVASQIPDRAPPHPSALEDERTPADGIALIQYTSGSTGMPKGVVVTHSQLYANCVAIRRRADITERDRIVSWLPLHHDMGLSAITQHLASGADLSLISTDKFMQNPLVWFGTIMEHGGTISPASTSSYGLMTRLAAKWAGRGLDLSALRYAWVGAEPVFHKHISEFADAYARFGLSRHALKPSYGLAEAVVAVSCPAPGSAFNTAWLDADRLRRNGEVKLIRRSEEALAFVGNGAPLDNIEVIALDDHDDPVVPGRAGRIHIRGESVTRAYLNSGTSRTGEAWLDTGDLGFIHDNEVFVTGRSKDLIIRNGSNISPQEIEWKAEECLGLRPGQTAAFSSFDFTRGKEEIVLVVGTSGRFGKEATEEEVMVRLSTTIGVPIDKVIFVPATKIPRTTSGKVQRHLTRELYGSTGLKHG